MDNWKNIYRVVTAIIKYFKILGISLIKKKQNQKWNYGPHQIYQSNIFLIKKCLIDLRLTVSRGY